MQTFESRGEIIQVGEGYRLLNEHDIIRSSDEYYDVIRGSWISDMNSPAGAVKLAGAKWHQQLIEHRRKVSKKRRKTLPPIVTTKILADFISLNNVFCGNGVPSPEEIAKEILRAYVIYPRKKIKQIDI